jgi:1-deoxy-D-xylulose-5-phosphate reductoisomerase
MVKRIAILGSTGSIGKNALRVIDSLNSSDSQGQSRYEIVALTAHSNIDLLAEQVSRYRPAFAAVTDPDSALQFQNLVTDKDVEIMTGPDALVDIANLDKVDIVVTAVVGAAGLAAVLAAAKKGKTLAIANKEPLVIAGEMLTEAVRKSGGKILPIDSEHSAIFQALQAGAENEVEKIILTSSGGPFRQATPEKIENVTVEQALSHPVWQMGPKITIDSATMMNKALEIIEARWLFDISADKIEVLIHPESIIHSLVEFIDGSVIAQLGTPDMCLPIQYALTYPDRVAGIAERLKLEKIGKLTFESPNLETFRSLVLAFEVAKAGGSAPVVFNAANEAAVEEFLAGRIKFSNIIKIIEHCLDKHDIQRSLTLETLLEVDAWAREQAKSTVISI